MLRWLTERRRPKILETSFPAAGDYSTDRDVPIARRIDDVNRSRMRELVAAFLGDNHF